MKALIFQDKVVDLAEIEFPTISTMQWVDCDNSVNIGYHYTNGTFKASLKLESELLQEAKTQKNKEIEKARDVFIYLPIEYNGSTFINSQIASANLQGAFTFAEEPIEWLDIDGNTVILSKSDIGNLARLIIQHRTSGYFQEKDLKLQVSSASTIEEVNNINIVYN